MEFLKMTFKFTLFLFFFLLNYYAYAVVPQKKISQQLVLDDAVQSKYPNASACLLNLNQVNDVTIASEVAGQCLCRNSANNGWENQTLVIDIATQVTDSQSTIANEDLIIFSDQSTTNNDTKYITFEDFKTSIGSVTTTGGTTGAPPFKVHDVTRVIPDGELANDDRFVVSDESITDDPNAYITVEKLRPYMLIDIHEDFDSLDMLTNNSGRDRFIFSSEGAGDTGNPNRYITYDNLKFQISNIANESAIETTMTNDDVMLFGDVSEATNTRRGVNKRITVANLKQIFGGGGGGTTTTTTGGAFDLHDDVSTEKTSPENADRFLISDEEATGDPNKYVTFQNLRSAVLTNLGNRFLVSAVADTETTIDNDDFMVFSDESATGDPNKKITVRNLKTVFAPTTTTTGSTTGTQDFDLHDDVGTEKASPGAADRFLISDEAVSGSPNKYVIFQDLKNAVGGLLPREIDDFDTFIPSEIDFLAGYLKGLYTNVAARELTKSLDVSARTEFLMKGNADEGIIFGGFDGAYKSDAYTYKVTSTGVTITALTKAGNASTLTLTSMGGVGSDTAGIIFGGNNGGNRINTMHYYSINEARNTFTIDSITRATGSATPPSISSMGMAGDLTSGIIFGGNLGQGRNNQILEYRVTGDATKEVTYSILPTIGLTNAANILSVSAPAVAGDATSGIIIGGFGGSAGTWSSRVIKYEVEPVPNLPLSQQTNRLRLTELTKSGDTLPAMDGGHIVGDETSGILFGGRNDSGRLATFYHYEVEGTKVTINELTLEGSITKRAYGRMVGDEESGVIFGGTDTSRINEFNFYATSAGVNVRKLTMSNLRQALTIDRIELTDNNVTDSDLLVFSDQGEELKPDKKINISNFKTAIGVLEPDEQDELDSIVPDSNDFFLVVLKTLGQTMNLVSGTITANNFTNRVGFAMVGDVNEAILFGGSQGTTYDDHIYSVIGSEDQYVINRLTQSGSTLRGRRWHDMAGDLDSGVIFGGHTASRQYSDFYLYELTGGTAVDIRALTNVGTISARYGHRMRGNANVGIIFGGYDGTNVLSDFYYYEVNRTTRQVTITELTKQGDEINAVSFSGMVGDETIGIIFGGRTAVAPTNNRQSNNFYRYEVNGGDVRITALAHKGDSISIRDRMYMAGDQVNGVIFGGFNGTNFLTDLYEYQISGDAVIITELAKSGTSGITAHGFIAGDTANGIIFGGDPSSSVPTTHLVIYSRQNDLFEQRTSTSELAGGIFAQFLLFGIIDSIPDIETTIANEDELLFADRSDQDNDKKISFEDLKTAIGTVTTTGGTTGAPPFSVHDVTEALTSPADEDRFVLSDESATGDPNKYITFENLKTAVAPTTTTGGSTTGTFNFSSVTERSVTPIAGDRFMIANARENNQNAYIQYDDLRTAILTNIGNRFLVSAVTDTETTIADDEFFVVSQGTAVNSANKKVTFENIKTLIRNAIETEFTVHDVSDALSAPANDDRFVLSDESATGDPNKYITFSNLRSSVYRTPEEVDGLTQGFPDILDYFLSYRAAIGTHPTMSFARRTRDAVTSRQGAAMAGDHRRGVIFGGYDGTTDYRNVYTYVVSEDGRDVEFILNHTFNEDQLRGIYPKIVGNYTEGFIFGGASVSGGRVVGTTLDPWRYIRDNEGDLTLAEVTHNELHIAIGGAALGTARNGLLHGGINAPGGSEQRLTLRNFSVYTTTATAMTIQQYPNTQVTPRSKQSTEISGHTMVGTPSKGAIFGGSSYILSTSATLYDSFYLYEFRNNNYHVKELTKTGDTISARQLHMMAGDATQGIIFGGVTDLATDNRSNEFFVYRVNEAETEVNFTEVTTLPSTIVGRDSMAFTGSALDGVMFGGDTGNGVSVDFIRWHEDVMRSVQKTTFEDLRKSLSIDGSPEISSGINPEDFLIHSDESSADKPNVKITFADLVSAIESGEGSDLASQPATYYGSRTNDNLSSAFILVQEKVYDGTVTSTRLLEADSDEARREFASAGDEVSGVIFGGRRGTTYLNDWQKYEVQADGTVVLTDLTVSGTNFPVAADPVFMGDKNLGVVAGGWNGSSVITTRLGYHVNYETNTVTLSTPQISGNPKTNLAGMASSHAIVGISNPERNKYTVIHGGFDTNGFHNQSYLIFTRPQTNNPTRVQLTASSLPTSNSPTQAYGSMAFGGASLFMFGGRESGVDNYSNKMYWAPFDVGESDSGWTELTVRGTAPSAREGVCITVDQGAGIGSASEYTIGGRGYQGLIIGGISTSGATTTYHNDVWLWWVSDVDNDGNPSHVRYRQLTGSTMGGRGLADCIGTDLSAIMFFGGTGHNSESREIWRLDAGHSIVPQRFNLMDLRRMLQ